MNLFERLILQEAPNPPQPNPEEEGQQPPNFVDGPEAQESAPEDPNAGQPEDTPPQDGGGEAPDQPDMNMGGGGEEPTPEEGEGGEGEEGSEDGDMEGGEEGGDEGLEGPEDQQQADDFSSDEQEVFSDLKPEQMAVKHKELKKQFKNFNDTIFSAIDKINNISHASYDDSLLSFISRKLLELKDMSRDYLLDVYDTKSYIENQIQLQKMVTTFNYITNLLSNIKQNREAEYVRSAKENDKNNNTRSEDYPYLFVKDIELD